MSIETLTKREITLDCASEELLQLLPRFSEDQALDMVAATIQGRPQIKCPLQHTFTKGLYCREIFMPAGIDVMSEHHNTQHQFVVLMGKVQVYLKGIGWRTLMAPDRGITEKGTRRVLRTITDVVWLTFHPTNIFPKNNSLEALEEAVRKVERKILIPTNPLINLSEVRELK